MKQRWLYLTHDDIRTEYRQCSEEGRELSFLEDEFARVLALDLEDLTQQPSAQALLDATIQLPQRAAYPHHEPNDLDAIRAARPQSRTSLALWRGSDGELLDRLHGAWTGRCVGCLLGKPVESWRRPRMWGYLRDLNRWPLDDFFRYDVATPAVREKYDLDNGQKPYFADQIAYAPEDDDTNYTTTGLAILQRHGRDFTPRHVAEFWLNEIPLLHLCTAERIAYRNFSLLIAPPHSAIFRNPYREWIGAQIRADFFGYACPGQPALAAEFAWRDASISHVKNGIYGEMWCAAMIAAAFVTEDVKTIIAAGLEQIPQTCRLRAAIDRVLQWHEQGVDYDVAVERLHDEWDETREHDWCHTISNAMIVAIALLWGEGDFGTTLCRAVQPCFDTDCNGATVGSILGIIHGRRALPARWADPINDTLHTGVNGYHIVKLEQMARESVAVARQIAA